MDLALLSGGSTPEILKFIDLGGILPALLIIALTIFILRLTSRSIDLLSIRWNSHRLLLKQISVITRFLLIAIGGFFAISVVLDLSGEGFSYFGGLLLLGLSFSSRDLIASLMSGIILLFDRPFQVGDRISFNGTYGEVLEIGIRSVRIQDLNDNLISIPNNQFLNSLVSSANAGNLDQMCVFNFYIGCDQNYEKAERIIYEAVSASRYVFWSKQIFVSMKEGVVPDGAERFAILLTAKAYVIDGRYETLFSSDVHKRVKQAFRRHNIRTAGELEWSSADAS